MYTAYVYFPNAVCVIGNEYGEKKPPNHADEV